MKTSRELVQKLMRETERGHPIDPLVLGRFGISSDRAASLCAQGWLDRLGRQTYLLAGDQLSEDGLLAYLCRRTPGLHLGGKSALDRQGVRHNVSFRPRLRLWSPTPVDLPSWATSRFDLTCQSTRLFDTAMPYDLYLRPLPGGHPGVLVSSRERALLELIADVSRGQSEEEVLNLFSLLRSIRPAVLDELLGFVRIKAVKDRFLRFSRREGFDWVAT